MSRSGRNSDRTSGKPAIDWAIRVTATVALALSLYLAVSSLGHTPLAGCADGALLDCDHVLGTAWSQWLGIPVALLGACLYALICLLSWWTLRGSAVRSAYVWSLLWLLSLSAAGAGIWFTGLQLFSVGKLCLYCLAVHSCGLLLATLVGWRVWRPGTAAFPPSDKSSTRLVPALRLVRRRRNGAGGSGPPSHKPWIATALAGCGVVALAGGQYFWPTATYQILEGGVLEEPVVLNHDPTDLPAAEPLRPAEPQPEPTASSQVKPATFTAKPPTETAAETADTHTATELPENLPAEDAATGSPDPPGSETAATPSSPAGGELKPPRRVIMLGGRLTVMPSRQPLIGSPDAPHIFLEIGDYTCKHCHLMHQYLEQARERYGGKFAVIFYPVPMDAACNPLLKKSKPDHKDACKYAQLALAVWSVDREAFAELHNWMMASTETVSLESAIQRAYQLVGEEAVKAAIASGETQRQINSYVQLFDKMTRKSSAGAAGTGSNGGAADSSASRGAAENSKRSLPIVILEDFALMGTPESADVLFELLETRVGLQPHDATAGKLGAQ